MVSQWGNVRYVGNGIIAPIEKLQEKKELKYISATITKHS